mmetsp:Transcript_10161/g.22530  ORF Transcript_10161/g.22530 Transcript_10161/m.22530 type:complete len:233 (-) Transcript_10161:439-1137(-)
MGSCDLRSTLASCKFPSSSVNTTLDPLGRSGVSLFDGFAACTSLSSARLMAKMALRIFFWMYAFTSSCVNSSAAMKCSAMCDQPSSRSSRVSSPSWSWSKNSHSHCSRPASCSVTSRLLRKVCPPKTEGRQVSTAHSEASSRAKAEGAQASSCSWRRLSERNRAVGGGGTTAPPRSSRLLRVFVEPLLASLRGEGGTVKLLSSSWSLSRAPSPCELTCPSTTSSQPASFTRT